MTFLTPLFLLGTLAVAGPILFHLVRRATRDRIPFSSLEFLRAAPPRLDRRSRVEHWLLLLLRSAAIVLLGLGFARPFLKGVTEALPGSVEARRVVVLVDTSASLRRPGTWERALERVRHHLRTHAGVQDLALIAFDRTPRVLVSLADWRNATPDTRAGLVEQRLAPLTPGWADTRLDAALQAGIDLLGESLGGPPPADRELIVVSDLQEGSRTESLQTTEWPKGVRVILDGVQPDRPGNAGIELLTGDDTPAEAASSGVRVRVVNSPDATADRFEIAWHSGASATRVGNPMAVQVPPGQSRVVALPRTGSDKADRIVLTGDTATFDNTVFVTARPTNAVVLRYVGPETDRSTRAPLYFLERALPEGGTPSVVWMQQPADAQAVGGFQTFWKLTIVAAPPSPAVMDSIRSQVDQGSTALVIANTPEAVNRLGALLGIPDLAGTPEASPGGALLVDIDFRHPLFAPFADPRFSDFSRMRIWKPLRLDPARIPDAKVLARLDSGGPALLEVPRGRGRIVIVPWGWSPADSQWVLSTKFVPFLMALLDVSGALPSDRASTLAVGDPVPMPSSAEGTARELELPSGIRVPAPTPGAPSTATATPGIHRLFGEGLVREWAVNVAPSESRTAATVPGVLDALGVPLHERSAAEVSKTPKPAIQAAAETEGRQKLWRWFLGATLLILVIETLAAGWAARRSKRNREGSTP